jgi:Leucine-rich repeat (LRR) protein
VGEGFVKKYHGRSLYEVGEGYLDELINKSLVEPVKFDGANKVCSCRVHDMVHDLITSLSNEENFLTTVCCQQPMDLPSKIRRLSIQTNIKEVANQLPPIIKEVANQLATMSLSHVRSLTVSNPAFSWLPALSTFLVLRVLDLTDCEQVDNSHWKDICSFFHLRYLSLKGTSITKIPKEIRNLQFLQVLDIRCTKIEEELPSTFIQIKQLVLLHMINSIVGAVPRWMCSMYFLFSLSITLETLGEVDLQVLGSIPSLTELYIEVKKPTQGRDKRLVICSGYPYQCLMRFSITSDMLELRFAGGAMQSLQTIGLTFNDVPDRLFQVDDFILGLENLSSLENVNVDFFNFDTKKMRLVEYAIKKEIDLHRKKPKLIWVTTNSHFFGNMYIFFTLCIFY